MTTPTQTTALLALLRARGVQGVTPLEALDAIGCFRLAARVYDLRADGYEIERKATVTAGSWSVVDGHRTCDHYATSDDGATCLRCGAVKAHKVVACYILHEQPAQMAAFG